jgi:hypothetical protein
LIIEKIINHSLRYDPAFSAMKSKNEDELKLKPQDIVRLYQPFFAEMENQRSFIFAD